MALTADLAAEILAACQSGASEAGAALSRALDGDLSLEAGAIAAQDALPALASAGLLIVLNVGSEAAVLAVPESSGMLPAWYTAPDATGVSKLATLAQELGMLLLPENQAPDDFAALAVKDMAAALVRAGLPADAGAVGLELRKGGRAATAWLVWPVATAARLAEPKVAASAPRAPAGQRPALGVHHGDLEEALPAMPSYTRSLLKIRVPIVVTLARTQQPLSRIVELAPGSIIPFDKSCDDTLCLEVNNREVAVGEAVKVGDKFGLRVTGMILPPERFVPLQGQLDKGARH